MAMRMIIHIPNQRLWEIVEAGEDIDQWLHSRVGRPAWVELTSLSSTRPYRRFWFEHEKDAIMFTLRWI
jgi:hypothetical protein